MNATHIDPDLQALAKFVSEKCMSRSDIGRLRDAKLCEIKALQARIESNRKPFDGDNFPVKRDTRRIGELRKEIWYLSSLFDPPSEPPTAA